MHRFGHQSGPGKRSGGLSAAKLHDFSARGYLIYKEQYGEDEEAEQEEQEEGEEEEDEDQMTINKLKGTHPPAPPDR